MRRGHPRAHERAFVLVPWLQADPHARLRVGDDARPVGDLLAGVDTSGVRPLQGEGWVGAPPSAQPLEGDGLS